MSCGALHYLVRHAINIRRHNLKKSNSVNFQHPNSLKKVCSDIGHHSLYCYTGNLFRLPVLTLLFQLCSLSWMGAIASDKSWQLLFGFLA